MSSGDLPPYMKAQLDRDAAGPAPPHDAADQSDDFQSSSKDKRKQARENRRKILENFAEWERQQLDGADNGNDAGGAASSASNSQRRIRRRIWMDDDDDEGDNPDEDDDSKKPIMSTPAFNYLRFGIPEYWSKDLLTDLNDYRQVVLHSGAQEYTNMKTKFEKGFLERSSSSHVTVHKIFRIENIKQWMIYNIEKASMAETLKGQDPEEVMWHATKSLYDADKIIRFGFNKGVRGARLFGNGIYFACDAIESDMYAHEMTWHHGDMAQSFGTSAEDMKHKQDMEDFKTLNDGIKIMFCCRVLSGNTESWNGSFVNGGDKLRPSIGYQSTSNPSHTYRCVFSPTFVYPEYMFIYSTTLSKVSSGAAIESKFAKPSSPVAASSSRPSSQSNRCWIQQEASETNDVKREILVSLQGTPNLTEYNLLPCVSAGIPKGRNYLSFHLRKKILEKTMYKKKS